MKAKYIIATIMISVYIFAVTSMTCLAFQFQDPTGDTSITDITNMNYQVTDEALEIVLDFVTIYSYNFITIKIDIDRSLVTGFEGGCLSREPSRFGADYKIRVETGSLPISDKAYLIYERFTSDPTQPIIETETVNIPIGNPYQPNGSTFQKTADQIYLKIPLQLFDNDLYPLYTPNTRTCVREFFPHPSSGLTPDAKRAYVNVWTSDPTHPGNYDHLPDKGMIDAESGKPVDSYTMMGDDLVDVIDDDPNDAILSGIFGDEITALQVYRHNDGNISLALELSLIESHDDSLYALNLDIDDDPYTGCQVSNESVTIGADIRVQFQNWGPFYFGVAGTPLYGEICFGHDVFCCLPYSHLGYLFLGSPGYIWTVIPKELMEPFLSSNKSGAIKILGNTLSPVWPHGDRDVVPNTGYYELFVNDISNSFPDARDDSAETDEDTAVNINVLANDLDPDGDSLSINSITQPEHGAVTNNGDGTVTYTPDADYTGEDSFEYTVSDGNSGSDTAFVNVIVNVVGDEKSSKLLISNATAFPGSTVTIELELISEAGVDISSLASDINYDPTVLSNPSARIGVAAEEANKSVITNEIGEDTFRLAIYSINNTNLIPDGVVAMITFDVNANAEIGTEIQVTQEASASDPEANDIFLEGRSGKITITNGCSGDCSGDGIVSISEVQTAVNQFLGTNEVQPCNDEDGNGQISINELQKVVNNFLEGC